MPKDKDLKRLVRARMAKTGESYTTARAHIVESEGAQNAPPEVLPLPADYEKLAGMSNDAVQNRTGRTWPEWAIYLDGLKAYEWEHPVIAAHLTTEFEFGGWWAQSITVAYERIRGLREVGQQRDGDYEANKSRTLHVSVADLYEAFATKDSREGWMDDARVTFHKATPERSMRGRTEEGYTVDVYFTEKAPEKSSVSIQVGRLPDAEAKEAQKTAWGERLDRLKSQLEAS